MNILYKMKEYIERMAVIEDGEWGACRELEQIIDECDMPEIYNEVLAAIKELEGMK